MNTLKLEKLKRNIVSFTIQNVSKTFWKFYLNNLITKYVPTQKMSSF